MGTQVKAKTKTTALTLLTKMFLKLSTFTNQNEPVHFFRFFREKMRSRYPKTFFFIYCNTKISNLSTEELAALKSLSKRKDVVIKAADKGGAVVVWRTDLYRQEAFRQLSNTSFYAKVDKDLTTTNQKLSKKKNYSGSH